VYRLLLVFVGSGVGGVLRYLVGGWAQRIWGPSFPFGTIGVNLIGSFLIVVIMHLALARSLISPEARIFLTTGVMGGLTTYSSFNYETVHFFETGAVLLGMANLGVTVLGCLVASGLGIVVTRLIG